MLEDPVPSSPEKPRVGISLPCSPVFRACWPLGDTVPLASGRLRAGLPPIPYPAPKLLDSFALRRSALRPETGRLAGSSPPAVVVYWTVLRPQISGKRSPFRSRESTTPRLVALGAGDPRDG